MSEFYIKTYLKKMYTKKRKESTREAYLRDQVKSMGGKFMKWVSPGHQGPPDRIVLMPNGLQYFLEAKADGGKLTDSQKIMFPLIHALGFTIYVCHSDKVKEDYVTVITEMDFLKMLKDDQLLYAK